MSYDVGEVKESLENEQLCSFSNLSVISPTSQLVLQLFRRSTYVTDHSPTLPLLQLRHNSFSNPSFASPTLQALHLRHLASRPWYSVSGTTVCKGHWDWVLLNFEISILIVTTLIFLLCTVHHKDRENTKFQFNWSFSFRDIFKLIITRKFQNAPCALCFQVKHSTFFCKSFRACIVILGIDFTINKLFFVHNNKIPFFN